MVMGQRESTRRADGAFDCDRTPTALGHGGADGSSVVALRGTVARPDARRLQARALEPLRAGPRRIAVDLSGVGAIEAGLIGALRRVRRGLTQIGGELTLISDGPPASELVRAAGPDSLARLTNVSATSSSYPGSREYRRP